MTRSLGIAIPCYNEAGSLIELIDRLSSERLKDISFLLVDNGSTDETNKILNNASLPPNVRWFRIPVNQGYGSGILAGLSELETDYLGWIHADLQIDPLDLSFFLGYLEADVDFLKGRRTGRPISDRFFTLGMSILLSIMFGKILRDINGQPTIISRHLYEKWNNPPHDFGLDLYSYVHAVTSQSRTSRVKVNFGTRFHGNSSWNAGFFSRLRFIYRTVKLALKLRLFRRD